MFREAIKGLGDPRLKRPIVAVLVSYAAWSGLLLVVSWLGWVRGTDEQRVLAAALPMLPILAAIAFLIRAHARADEVERAMHAYAASAGFVAMLAIALLAMHLDRVAAPVQLTTTHVWSAGILAWIVGLANALRKYR
jgi:hypothetical protein